jgi:16S rRNA (guanine966-N2)-methyltransferase
MRIVAGELRGRRLVAPTSGATRPTTDKVREAVFNALVSLDVVVGARVLDLYAGSGALGIEALSRGADHCTFVERDRIAVRAIDENVATLGLRSRARVVVADAIATAPSIDPDLAFADPPYGFDDWPRLLRAVQAPLLVAEADVEVGAELAAAQGWDRGRIKRYGRTWVTFLHRLADASGGQP